MAGAPKVTADPRHVIMPRAIGCAIVLDAIVRLGGVGRPEIACPE